MLRTRNKYCSNCLRTERFLDLGTHLVCQHCSKRLEVMDDAGHPKDGARPEGRLLVWAEASRREAV